MENQSSNLGASQESRVACEGDLVIVDFDAHLVSGKRKTSFSGSSKKNYEIRLGRGREFRDLEYGIIGMAIGETREIKVDFPSDYWDRNVAGRTGAYKVILRSIDETEVIEPDAE